MAGGRALSFRKRKGSSPLHPPLRKETAFSRYFSGMGASYVEIAWLGRRIGGGCLSAACAFRVGASNCRKKTRLCGNGFSRKAKPRTAPYCLKPACAFREGASNCRKERACAALDFRARLSRALHRIARMLQALSGRGRAIAEKNAPVRRWIFAQGQEARRRRTGGTSSRTLRRIA